ncbi:MAG: hypothetical protein R3F62_24775 [Planctomycetota bacterium]
MALAAGLRLAVAGLALGLALSAGGCRSDGPRDQGPRPEPVAPSRGQVYEAILRFGDRLHVLYRTWPAHLARSVEHPELPLVEVREVENRSELEDVDLQTLGWELNQQLRNQGKLWLLSDEPTAVASHGGAAPPRLGEGATHAGLVIQPWVDAAGRFCFLLEDAVKEQTLVVARSDPPESSGQ